MRAYEDHSFSYSKEEAMAIVLSDYGILGVYII